MTDGYAFSNICRTHHIGARLNARAGSNVNRTITYVSSGHDLPLDNNLVPGQPYYMLFQPLQGLPDIVTTGKKLGRKLIAKIEIISRLQHIITSYSK